MSAVPKHSLHIPDLIQHQGSLSRLIEEADSGRHLAILSSGLLSADTEERERARNGGTGRTRAKDKNERHEKDSKEVERQIKPKGETNQGRKRERQIEQSK